MKAFGLDLNFERVSFSFGHRIALDDISLRCPAGAVTCIVGPKGAGKSTAIATAAGLLNPAQGRVTVGARVVRPFARVEGVSYLPQASHFPPVLTAGEVLVFAASISRADRKRVEEVLGVTGVGEILDRKMGELPGGWMRRLGLAWTLVQPAGVVLLDEPLVDLDPGTLDRLIGHLAALAGRDVAVVMAAQEFETIDLLRPHVAVLDQGRLVSRFEPGAGPSRRLYRAALCGTSFTTQPQPPRTHAG